MYMELGKFDEFGKVQLSAEMHTEPPKCGLAVLRVGGHIYLVHFIKSSRLERYIREPGSVTNQ